MSQTTCGRSGGAALYAAAHDKATGLYWALIEMQREQDELARRSLTSRRIHQRLIDRAHRRRAS